MSFIGCFGSWTNTRNARGTVAGRYYYRPSRRMEARAARVCGTCRRSMRDESADDAGAKKKRLDAYQMIEAGVMPEDRDAWNRGWMRGYDGDGAWIPGPNAGELEEEEYEEYKRNSQLVFP